MRWNKLKESKWILPILISFLLMGCANTAVAGNEIKATDVPKEPVQPSKKILKDGQVLIRHAGDEWSRQKIVEYLKNNSLQLDLRRSGGPIKEICPEIASDLKGLQFIFFEPELVVDDWDDPRLAPFKQKYEKFKYGMGYVENYGSDNPTLPTWNINIYNLDTDNDGVSEIILYGERLWARFKSGEVNASYNVFESNINWAIGDLVGGDPSSPAFKPDDYVLSALIKIRDIDAVLNVNDYAIPGRVDRELYAWVFWLNLQDITRKEPAYHINSCFFELNPDAGLNN